MKMAGGPRANRMDVNEFFVQAAEYERGAPIFTSLHKFFNVIYASHPFPVVRLTELQTWVNSGAYSSILSQNYRTRQDENSPAEEILKHFKAASESYTEHFDYSQDALAGVMSDVFSGLESWSGQARQGLESLFDIATKVAPHQPSSAPAPTPSSTHAAADRPQTLATASEQEIFNALEKLGDLKQKGVLTEEEFEAQKTKLLNRL
jgi:hypothetical protein